MPSGATVRRLVSAESLAVTKPAHGGQAMDQTPTVRPRADGTLVLDSVRDLSPFSHSGWYGGSIAVEHPNYVRRVIKYTLGNSTNTAKGGLVVATGDIRLKPKTAVGSQ